MQKPVQHIYIDFVTQINMWDKLAFRSGNSSGTRNLDPSLFQFLDFLH